MGWDADAIYANEPFGYVECEKDNSAKQAFSHAVEKVLSIVGQVDGYLEHGGLDISGHVRALAKYANESDKAAIWSESHVKELAESINWPDQDCLTPHAFREMINARVFLETCAEHGYGIQFDP